MPRQSSSLTDLDLEGTGAAETAFERTAVDLAPLGADATSEIEAVDILEVDGAITAASTIARAPHHHPSTLAPIALDLSAPRVTFPSLPSWSPTPTDAGTLQLARAAGAPFFSARTAIIATSIVGLGSIAGAAGALLGYSQGSRAPTAGPTIHAPRTAVILGARLVKTPATHRKGLSSSGR